jgi:hypothetical protein
MTLIVNYGDKIINSNSNEDNKSKALFLIVVNILTLTELNYALEIIKSE